MIKLIRDEVGPLLIDILNQTYQRIPDTRNKFFVNGKMFDFAETIGELTSMPAIVPVFCVETGEKGKRQYVKLLSGDEHFTFFNVEKIGSQWRQNEISKIFPNKAYFAYFEPQVGAENGYLIMSSVLVGSDKLRAGIR